MKILNEYENLTKKTHSTKHSLSIFVDIFVKRIVKNLNLDTEDLIKEKAKQLYFAKGVFDASTQEVADFAGVKRTLVNYYFRSKKKLFQIVYLEVIKEMRLGYAAIYVADLTFREKVEALLDYTMALKEKYPYLEVFNISESNKLVAKGEGFITPEPMKESKIFLKEIEKEMERGTIPTYEPINFLINIFSLISFPMVMKPVFRGIFCINSEEEYQEIYEQRKQMAMTILFNNGKIKSK